MSGQQSILPVIALLSLVAAVGAAAWQAKQDQQPRYPRQIWPLIRLFYFIIIPYFTIVSGIIPPRLFGLTGAEYVAPQE